MIKIDNRIERTISITENIMNPDGDIEEIVILQVYMAKTDNGIEMPSPTIFVENIYNKNKDIYDSQISKAQADFREEFDIVTKSETQDKIDELQKALDDLILSQLL